MKTSQRLRPFGTSIFSEMSALAAEHGAVNLSQGFPDFEGPPEIVESACSALREGHNQYARSMGHPELVEAIAAAMERDRGLRFDPMREIGVFGGATEALAAAALGLLEPGDEVIVFEPFYDSYPADLALAGAVPRYVTLRFPDFALDREALNAAVSTQTRAILLNNPHNPSGKVFSRTELEAVAELCLRHQLFVISDEVYEHITFDGREHLSIAGLPGMRERCLTISSAGKTYSMTGWKVGWACGPEALVAGAQAAHQFLTFCNATPLQVAVARTLSRFGPAYHQQLRADYERRRDFLMAALRAAGFQPACPQGTYFILAGFDGLFEGDDRAFARHLIEAVGVAAIPPSAFYRDALDEGGRLLRFAFCKRMATLEAAAERLARIAR